LANVQQHAQANRVQVKLELRSADVRLVVEDNGDGFDPENVPVDHYGLIGINERVKLLDGQLRLESSPGSGTRLEVLVPIRP
jgi:signal transduction histidine kinase